jgi:lipopolysaccharide transport system ATP-binding protein
MTTVIKVENISKQYRLGQVGTGTLSDDLTRLWYRIRGKEDPFLKIGQSNDRTKKAAPSGSEPKSGLLSRISPLAARDSSDLVWALKDINFEVKEGEVLGIIGRNGAGKSTLLKILARVTTPTTGSVKVKGRIASLLEVGTGFHPDLTGRENIYLNGAILGMRKHEITRKLDEIIDFSGCERYIDTPVKRYSSGMYVRLAFAVAAHLDPEILIVDEVLAVGDAEFQKKCLGKMKDVAKCGRTVLFVSHNMGAMLKLCTRGIFLSNGSVACDGYIEDTVAFYNEVGAHRSAKAKGIEPNVLYQSNLDVPIEDDFVIAKVELLDNESRPIVTISTWDSFTIRIHYSVFRRVERGSVVFQISGMDGTPLMYLSTQPDGTLPMSFEVGENYVDCMLKSLPLGSGDFLLSIGLAIPQVEMLCWKPDLCVLTVHPKDVYSSGMAPQSGRSILAIAHEWKESKN